LEIVISLKQLMTLMKETGVGREKLWAFFFMFERRKKMHMQIVSQYLKKKLFLKAMVPYSAEIEKMGLYRKPVGANTISSISTAAYKNLWLEISRKAT